MPKSSYPATLLRASDQTLLRYRHRSWISLRIVSWPIAKCTTSNNKEEIKTKMENPSSLPNMSIGYPNKRKAGWSMRLSVRNFWVRRAIRWIVERDKSLMAQSFVRLGFVKQRDRQFSSFISFFSSIAASDGSHRPRLSHRNAIEKPSGSHREAIRKRSADLTRATTVQ